MTVDEMIEKFAELYVECPHRARASYALREIVKTAELRAELKALKERVRA